MIAHVQGRAEKERPREARLEARTKKLPVFPDPRYLACSSDKGTVHVFSLGAGRAASRTVEAPAASPPPPAPAASPPNARSNLSFLRRVIPGIASSYLESEWSFAQVRGLDAPTLCAFGAEPNTIVCVGADGSFLVSKFGAAGGECERVSYHKFIRSDDEEAENRFFDTPPPPATTETADAGPTGPADADPPAPPPTAAAD